MYSESAPILASNLELSPRLSHFDGITHQVSFQAFEDELHPSIGNQDSENLIEVSDSRQAISRKAVYTKYVAELKSRYFSLGIFIY